MSAQRVLVVDDEPEMVENCTRLLRRAGYRVLSTTDSERALALLESERPDLLLTDLKMPGIDGLELMRRAHDIDAALPVVVITGFASIDSAVAAIKEHLAEVRVVTCGRQQRGPAGDPGRPNGRVAHRRALAGCRVDLGLRRPREGNRAEAGIFETERLADAFDEEPVEAGSGGHLDHPAEDVGRHSVLPRAAGLVGEGDLREPGDHR